LQSKRTCRIVRSEKRRVLVSALIEKVSNQFPIWIDYRLAQLGQARHLKAIIAGEHAVVTPGIAKFGPRQKNLQAA
jgi:hypothetical protein